MADSVGTSHDMRARSFRTRRAAVLVVAGAVCAVAITVGAQGTAHPLWTFTSEQDIASYGLINSGDLFVSTKTEFIVLDSSTGDVVWKTTDFENCVSDGRDLECRYLGRHAWQILFPGTTYVRTYFDERVVIHDLTSGEKVFDSIDHEIGKVISHRQYLRPVSSCYIPSEATITPSLASGSEVPQPCGRFRSRSRRTFGGSENCAMGRRSYMARSPAVLV